MNRAQTVLKNLEETVETIALVHPDHASSLEKRLKENKIPHHKHKDPIYVQGYPWIGFGIRPEAWQPFQSCCNDCQNASSSPHPVCAGTASSTGFAGGGAAGASGGMSSGSVGGGFGSGGVAET